MYSQDKINIALQVYHQCGSATEPIRVLGYPTRRTLYTWISSEGIPKSTWKELTHINTAQQPRNLSLEVKMDALHRCFELEQCIKSVAEESRYTSASIYARRKKYLQGDAATLKNDKNIPLDTLRKGNAPVPASEIKLPHVQIQDMQIEIDILKETSMSKIDPGIDQTALKNSEKAGIIDALKEKYSLPTLLRRFSLSQSSYYYQETVSRQEYKYNGIHRKIAELFLENKECYRYQQIHGLLKREGGILSEKVVRQIMREERLEVKTRKRRKYSSYQKEISPSVPNVLERNFHADRPNEKWLTNITEFTIPAGRIYFAPILDCFDGMVISGVIGTGSDAALMNGMLD